MAVAAAAAAAAELAAVHAGIEEYYTGLVTRFGARPRGVDWTCVPTQQLRFVQLLKLCDFAGGFSLNDVGCGYGALLDYLRQRHPDVVVDYHGVDLSAAMVQRARRRWRARPETRFSVAGACPRVADFSVASGIFNVKLDETAKRWEAFIAQTLADMHATSRRGFAVNFMAPLPRGRTPVPQLYRTPPGRWIRFCQKEFSGRVEVLGDYGMREFTLLVRR